MSSLIWSLVGASLAAAFFGALAAQSAGSSPKAPPRGRCCCTRGGGSCCSRRSPRSRGSTAARSTPVVAGFALVQAVACMVARACLRPTEDRRA